MACDSDTRGRLAAASMKLTLAGQNTNHAPDGDDGMLVKSAN
jgi:hypothetical protein